jgi:hypothetical protein
MTDKAHRDDLRSPGGIAKQTNPPTKMSIVYEDQGIDTNAEDAPLNWPHEKRLERAIQWAIAPGANLPVKYLADFYRVTTEEIRNGAKKLAPPAESKSDYKESGERVEGERKIGGLNDDGEWEESEDESPPEGVHEIE